MADDGTPLTLSQAVTGHLWTKGVKPPQEFVTLILCRDVYHCRPSQLREESAAQIQRHLTCLTAESKVHELKSKAKHA